jgi:hypothetical protein|tara:strand:- start:176 stop:394 length:219 start_codon:yes stop_codon:yes gene_type:complete
MTGRYTDYDNVADFTAHKMKQLLHDMRKLQRADIVTVLEDALASYEAGLIDIHFVNGWPHISHSNEENDMSD